MKGRNYPYAYNNLKDSLNELTPHLKKATSVEIEAPILDQYISRGTPQQLKDCTEKLTTIKQDIGVKYTKTFLSSEMAVGLLDRFLQDATRFTQDLEQEFAVKSSGLVDYLNEGSNVENNSCNFSCWTWGI